jgi:multidrug efflux system membrane fusion protein
MDQLATNAAALEASVAADEATVDTFKVRLTYNTIVSPMDGRIGVVGLKAGNEVKAQDTITMLTINQIKPIYVAYSVPQNNLPAIRAAMKAGIVPVTASIPGDNNGLDPGRVSLFDNQIDAATGTIGLRAIFDNNDERLWPGEFVNVTTTVRVDPDALVIPQAALLVGQNGNYVYVVKSDGTVEARTVTVDRTVANQTVVSKGLAEGERVVTDGQSRVTDGTRVEIRTNAGGGNQAERSS